MKHFSLFAVVGLFNTLVGYVIIFACMILYGMSPELSNVLGFSVGLLFSYLSHSAISFAGSKSISYRFARFSLVVVFSYGISFLFLILSVRIINMNAVAAQVASGIVYVGMSYLLHRRHVFHSQKAGTL